MGKNSPTEACQFLLRLSRSVGRSIVVKQHGLKHTGIEQMCKAHKYAHPLSMISLIPQCFLDSFKLSTVDVSIDRLALRQQLPMDDSFGIPPNAEKHFLWVEA